MSVHLSMSFKLAQINRYSILGQKNFNESEEDQMQRPNFGFQLILVKFMSECITLQSLFINPRELKTKALSFHLSL